MANPGDKISIKINGRSIETEIDKDGTQRLPKNSVIVFLMMTHQSFDYNELARWEAYGFVSQEDQRFIYQNNGYSVCGYQEIFPDDKIENPLWEGESGND